MMGLGPTHLFGLGSELSRGVSPGAGPPRGGRFEAWHSCAAGPQFQWGQHLSLLLPCQVQPEVDGLESSPGGAQKWGRLQLSLEYDFGSQEVRAPLHRPGDFCGLVQRCRVQGRPGGPRLSRPRSQIRVGLKQAVDLRARDPSGTADPYARISLSAQAGRRHETKVHRGTLCPVFNETCCFHVSLGWGRWGGWARVAGARSSPSPQVPPQELPQTTLRVQVLDFRRFSRHEPLGELCLPLGTVGLQHVLEFWHPLGPPSTPEVRPLAP